MLNLSINNKEKACVALLLSQANLFLGGVSAEDQKRYSAETVTQLVPTTANLGYTW